MTMNVGSPASLPLSVVGLPMALANGSEVEHSRVATSHAARQADARRRANSAAEIPETSDDLDPNQRDGRTGFGWQVPARTGPAEPTSPLSPSSDEPVGRWLDVSG